jgi:N-methylhydantoinase B
MTTTADRVTTTHNDGERPATDPIDLEVVRSRLEAIGEQAALAVEHTAISPTITESKDYSVTIMDPAGGLIVGSGMVLFHFGAASYSIKATIERFGDTIAPGDVFFANDPHHGGGLHPQDVMIQRPIFHQDELVGWVGLSAHMMDMGGMVVGSFAPQATDCYQEGLRLPAVRLFRKGEEMTDIWDIIVNNIRMSEIVEMDLRGLVAGCHSAQEQLEAVVESMGRDRFVESLRAIRELTEAEMRRRILAIEDGVYRSTSWTEYGDEFYQIPCTLTVDGDHIVLDFDGASPQTDHYFNSKPYIVAAEFIVMLAHRIARDLPFNEGIFAPIELRCPEGSIVNSTPPAPIAAAHMHVGLNAADVAMQAFNLALGASPDSLAHRYLTGAGFESALGNNLWSWQLPDGSTDAFLAFDGNWVGGSAGRERDGTDLGRNPVGIGAEGSIADIEILESWFPLLFTERRARPGSGGAGVHRAGGGTQLSFRPHGVDQVNGTMFGMRRWLPLQGLAGGSPGACNEFLVHHRDGSIDELDPNSAGTPMVDGDSFEMRLGSGGGFGDPLDREPASVAADVASGRFAIDDADRIYGIVLGSDGSVDPAATATRRDAIRADRLARAHPPLRPQGERQAPQSTRVPAFPLYPGVVQQGNLAFAEATGQVLAEAPAHWTDGCPVLEERRWPADGPDVVFRTYLDPASGRALHVEVALAEGPRSFEVNPRRWTEVD